LTTGQDAPAKQRPQKFRSPFAVAIWWLWALFALGNLIDLAVQGRNHGSVDTAFAVLLITGVVYTAALRPRIVADSGGMTLANPLRDHRVGWAAVVGIDAAELIRVRCKWPLDDGGTGSRAIYSWAVHSSRRKQAAARMRERRRAARAAPGARGFGAFGAPPEAARPPAPTAADADHVITALTALADQARAAAPDERAVPPVSTWNWMAVALIVVPALALLIAVFA
jgi:PH (Pleckstrin Homology) domain-containing protein